MVKAGCKPLVKVDCNEAMLKDPEGESVSVPIRVVDIQRSQRRRFAGILFVITMLLCMVTLALGFWLRSERGLPQFCCSCDQLKETSGVVRKGKSCCINTESEYVQTMKHMLAISGPDEFQDHKALISEKEKKMLQAKQETITLLHSSPVAAHVLVACTNSTYYPYPKEVRNRPATRTLTLLPGRSLSLLREVGLSKDHLIIQTKGLYLIYSQIYFKVITENNWPLELKLLCHIVERYNKRLPNDGIEKLLQSTYTLPLKSKELGNRMFDFHTSYISGVVELEVNDEVYVRATLEDVVSRFPTLNYIGLVKLDR